MFHQSLSYSRKIKIVARLNHCSRNKVFFFAARWWTVLTERRGRSRKSTCKRALPRAFTCVGAHFRATLATTLNQIRYDRWILENPAILGKRKMEQNQLPNYFATNLALKCHHTNNSLQKEILQRKQNYAYTMQKFKYERNVRRRTDKKISRIYLNICERSGVIQIGSTSCNLGKGCTIINLCNKKGNEVTNNVHR